MDKMPEGTYVVAVSIEDKNPDGTPEHSVFGPIEFTRLAEWNEGPGEYIAEGGDDWEFCNADEVVGILLDIGVPIADHIIINNPWPTDEGFTNSAIFLANKDGLGEAFDETAQ